MNRSFSIVFIGFTLTGCTEVPDVSKACMQMCTSATDLYGECLAAWEMAWSDAGFENAAAHQESCEVWSWEIAELHGRTESNGLCRDRADLLNNGECSDYTGIDWNETP